MAQRRRSKKWIFKLVFLALLVVTGVVVYLVKESYFTDGGEEEDAPQPVVVEEKLEVKDTGEEVAAKPEETVVEKEKVIQYEGEDPNTAEELTGVVTYAGVTGDKLLIRVNIDQYVAEGSCTLKLVSDGETVYSDETEIEAWSMTSTCKGFDVPLVEIGGEGIDIEIKLEADEKMGIIRGEAEL